jgi:NADPH2:quinone reductase
MQAAWFENPGPAHEVLQIGEWNTPTPKANEVRIRLHASAVNPSDVKKRAGAQAAGLEGGAVIPHSDGAGVIDAVGPGISKARIGERVWVYQAQYQRRFGTAAQFVTLPAQRAVTLPNKIDFEVGACLGIPAMTAHRAVFANGPVKGRTFLITGASGRVGHYAVQWAKWEGAKVIATVGIAERATEVSDAGADHVLNFREQDVAENVMELTDGAGVDQIVDVEFGVNLETSVKVLKTGGVITSYSSTQYPEPKLPFYPMMFQNVTVRLILVYNMPESAKRQAAAQITEYLEHERFIHRVAETHPLENIAGAHEAIERGGSTGAVIVKIT